jgi:hypothetical protein
LGWGCGIPEPLGICVAGYPDIHPYVPDLCGATLGRCRGLPGQTVHRPRATRAIHIEVWGGAQTGQKPGDIYA